jgi:hypothetical protein
LVGRNIISIHVLEVIDDGVTSLVGRNNIISMHASTPEDDTPVIYHAVVQKYSHTQEVVVASFIVWLIGIESACMHACIHQEKMIHQGFTKLQKKTHTSAQLVVVVQMTFFRYTISHILSQITHTHTHIFLFYLPGIGSMEGKGVEKSGIFYIT